MTAGRKGRRRLKFPNWGKEVDIKHAVTPETIRRLEQESLAALRVKLGQVIQSEAEEDRATGPTLQQNPARRVSPSESGVLPPQSIGRMGAQEDQEI
jgi:hypothetical protein